MLKLDYLWDQEVDGVVLMTVSLSVTRRCLDDFSALQSFWNGRRGQLRGKDSPGFVQELQWLGKLMASPSRLAVTQLYPQVVGQEEETATSRKKSNNNNNNSKGNKFHPGQVKKCLGKKYYVNHKSCTRSGILLQDAF